MSLALSATQPAPSCSEHELVAAVREGSDRAFEELYARYRARLSAYILRLVGDHSRAEDIAQEVFISALRKLRDSERPIIFKPWIYEIAKNACIDEHRRTRRTREVPLEPHDGGESAEAVLPIRGQTPELAVERKQSLADLSGAFHGLAENHRKIIVMREFEGRSYNEISEQLGMTRPMVESTLFRARRRLTEEYDELVSGRRCLHVQALIDGDQLRSSRALGLRERRQVARHLAHCQPCRRHARRAEVDESLFTAPGLARKLAGLLPIPWLSLRGGHARGSAAAHRALAFQQGSAGYADLLASSGGLGRAAAAIAAIGIAGVGGGVATVVANPGSKPLTSKPAALSAPLARPNATATPVTPAADQRDQRLSAAREQAVLTRNRQALQTRRGAPNRARSARGGGSGGGAAGAPGASGSQAPSTSAPSSGTPSTRLPTSIGPVQVPQGGSGSVVPPLPSPPAVSHPSVSSVVNRVANPVLNALPNTPATSAVKQTLASAIQLTAPATGKLRLG
jgi:RNA polymerase sigma factor (sigma-70 family)